MATTGKVTRQDREQAWNELRRAAKGRKTRPFYRAVNKHGLMYAGDVQFRFLLHVGMPLSCLHGLFDLTMWNLS